ncbi:unnamed protein product [Rotaria socialis]|uniref:Uncharacterized protein n=1 Tax=Rotaria socialis TaxID=392032 RepID=A0A820QTG6_9BILA|nr:unnamed protein product [Rotaria socialis]CAF3679456.1 unnamed protein product [Rotaria socialis]CAF4424200.1 unnamed protein product [Rotaria socialis]CAF4759972.1 unnamed protein product [Rotaria socialis]
MLTSPRSNGVDNFVPSHHLALITQPVLGARSRSRKKTNIIVETSTSTKEKLDSMTSSRRSSYNDSPPLMLPINRIDTSQYQKKINVNSYHESSDSGLDLSLSTNSSVQFQQYSQQHFPTHRPLSALNEDSSPDDGYHDDHEQVSIDIVRLRCPPASFGRNRSMEDMISNTTREEQQQQYRSSSFSDERQQKLPLKDEKKMKRSSDGALLDLVDTSPESTDSYRRMHSIKHELLYPLNMQQHRSLNDLTNKTSSRAIRNDSNMPAIINNLPTAQTTVRKPNTSTLKPSRKKTKFNILMEPSVPLTSSRLTVYDEQINTMTATTSSSSNQTTPRSIRPLGQQQQHTKSKATIQLSHYPNQEQIRAHVNRSVIERQHATNLVAPTRRGVIQQIIPFDASPSKVNNLLLRHYVHQTQPTNTYHQSSNIQSSPSRQVKQTLKTLYNDETSDNNQEERRKQKEQIKIKKLREYQEKKHLKQKDDFENNPSNEIHLREQRRIKNIQGSIPPKKTHKHENSQDTFEQTINQQHFIGSTQRQQEKELSFEKNHRRNKIVKNRSTDENVNIDERQSMENMFSNTPRRQYEQKIDSQHRLSSTNDPNQHLIADKHEFVQFNNTTNKLQNTNFITRRQQQQNVNNIDDSIYINQANHSNRDIGGKQQVHGLKPTVIYLRNKTQNNTNDKNLNRTNELNSQYGSDYLYGAQNKSLVTSQSRPSKVHFQLYESSTYLHPLIETQTNQNRRRNSNYENDEHAWQKPQTTSMPKTTRTKPIIPKNTNITELKREREISQLSNISKVDSTQYDDMKFNQKRIEKSSTGSFQTKSPVSWSIVSEHHNDQEQYEVYEKSNNYPSELSISPSSHEEFTENNGNTSSRTYRTMKIDHQQLFDGRYVIPSHSLHTPSVIDRSSHPSSCHTYPFTCTNDIENNNDTLIDVYSQLMKNTKHNSKEPDIYVLSDRDSTQNRIERQNSPSPLEIISSNKKTYSSPEKVIMSTEKEETTSNYDSDDGWSDDSAELLYVDERYARGKKNITSSSHLFSEQPYHDQVQQQNVLLQ